MHFLLRSLITAGTKSNSGPRNADDENGHVNEEDAQEFCLQLMLSIALHNRDRLHVMWEQLRGM